jgi:Flp pilus assembly protein TadG
MNTPPIMLRQRAASPRGQSLVEFAIVLPIVLVLALGVTEVSYALLDQHVVTKLTREGSNLISRDSSPLDAATALASMTTRPVNFATGAKVIFRSSRTSRRWERPTSTRTSCTNATCMAVSRIRARRAR